MGSRQHWVLGTHRHLHLKVISVELEGDVGESPLEKPRRAENEDQLQVCWEGRLGDRSRA